MKTQNCEESKENYSTDDEVSEGNVDPIMVVLQQFATMNKQINCQLEGIDHQFAEIKSKINHQFSEINSQFARIGVQFYAINKKIDIEIMESVMRANEQLYFEVKFDEKFSKLSNELTKFKVSVENKQIQVDVRVYNLENKVKNVEERLSEEIEQQLQEHKQDTQCKVDSLNKKNVHVEKHMHKIVNNCTGNVVELSKRVSQQQDNIVTKVAFNNSLFNFNGVHMKCYRGDGTIHPKDFIRSCSDSWMT